MNKGKGMMGGGGFAKVDNKKFLHTGDTESTGGYILEVCDAYTQQVHGNII